MFKFIKETMVYTITVNHGDFREKKNWKTSNGYVSLASMSEEHIINTIIKLAKRTKELEEFQLPASKIDSYTLKQWELFFRNELQFRELNEDTIS